MTKKKTIKMPLSIVKKYITKSVAFDVETPVGTDGSTVRLIGTFTPENQCVQLDHIQQLSGNHWLLEQEEKQISNSHPQFLSRVDSYRLGSSAHLGDNERLNLYNNHLTTI